MMRNVWTIFCKEMLELRRDAKTLLLIVLLPLLAFPVLTIGLARYKMHLMRERAMRTVVIATDARSREDYSRLVHQWVVASDVARPLAAASPMSRLFLDRDAVKGKPGGIAPQEALLSQETLSSPESLRTWAHGYAFESAQAMEAIQSRPRRGPRAPDWISEALVEKARRFYRVAVQSLGLLRFTDPADLETPPESFSTNDLPETVREIPDIRRIAYAIQTKRIHAWLHVPPRVESLTASDDERLEIVLLHDSTIPFSEEARQRFEFTSHELNRRVVESRLTRHGFREVFLRPLELRQDMNLASQSKQILAIVGGIIPYMIILFSYLGGTSPATDTAAGEKERLTLESLLLTPAGRLEIALGKFGMVFCAAMTAALMGVVSLGLTAMTLVPTELLEQLDLSIRPIQIVLMASVVVPIAVTFASVLLALSVYARSYKEAQAHMTPVVLLLLIPAFAAMFPEIELTPRVALIPLVNVSVFMRELIKGEIEWLGYGLTLLSSLVVAVLCLGFAVRQFGKEEVLFRR